MGGWVYLELEVGVKEEVLGLDVPVVDASVVAEGKGGGELGEDGFGHVLFDGRGGWVVCLSLFLLSLYSSSPAVVHSNRLFLLLLPQKTRPCTS